MYPAMTAITRSEELQKMREESMAAGEVEGTLSVSAPDFNVAKASISGEMYC
jgi:hypothetical protein